MTLQKLSFKKVHQPCSKNDRGHIHEERRLRIEELDKWQAHKSRTHDKPKLRQNEFDTSPNLLKVGDKVLLDAADPHIVTTTPNEEIPLTILSIFPFGTVEVSHPKFSTFKVNNSRLKPYFDEIDSRNEEPSMSSSRGKKTVVPASNKRKGASIFCGSNHENSSPSSTVSTRAPRRALPNTSSLTFSSRPLHRLGCRRTSPDGAVLRDNQADIPRAHDGTLLNVPSTDRNDKLSVPEFCAALGLYTEEFREENKLHSLSRHIHFSHSKCWHTLAPNTASYNPSRSKASILPPSLRYLYTILAHTITGRRESTGVINTYDVYFLRCMSQGHIIDLTYFIAHAIQYQTERHRKGVISIGPYVTRLARHFGLLNTTAQESSLTLIGQMSPQGISSMLSIRMIERR
ncbi:hypothetical protein GOBAR_AA17768 [Gossypium barbadense]|uniref:Uncharacterized protein n=1 Tax=Gossypium barbadense TaxID=3634 RepID=A0A2P5XHQ2_GOSBA|nr:hypothetical protein GOBAR_AA17768 [Gossypium barbadense]